MEKLSHVPTQELGFFGAHSCQPHYTSQGICMKKVFVTLLAAIVMVGATSTAAAETGIGVQFGEPGNVGLSLRFDNIAIGAGWKLGDNGYLAVDADYWLMKNNLAKQPRLVPWSGCWCSPRRPVPSFGTCADRSPVHGFDRSGRSSDRSHQPFRSSTRSTLNSAVRSASALSCKNRSQLFDQFKSFPLTLVIARFLLLH